MARMRMKTHGVKKAIAEVGEFPEETRDGAEAALKQWSRDTRATARSMVPVRTGRLRRAITFRTNKKKLNGRVGVWNDDAFYAYFIEHGTSHHAAEPFLLPAWEANRPGAVKAASDEIKGRLT